jgi:hypothetical protein
MKDKINPFLLFFIIIAVLTFLTHCEGLNSVPYCHVDEPEIKVYWEER